MNLAMERNAYASAGSVLEESNCLISMPAVCHQLREVIADSAHTRKDVVDIISHDPALTTRLLRIVNSAYYGLGHPVRDLNHALSILGEQELNNLVMVTSIVNSIRPSLLHMDMNDYWRSSLFCAVMARSIARHCKLDDSDIEECFISGLLLNIGKLLLYYSEPELHAHVELEMDVSGRPDHEVEKELLGFDHADVGALMSQSWGFSRQLSQNIANHHRQFVTDCSIEDTIMLLAGDLSDRIDLGFPQKELPNVFLVPEVGLLRKIQLSDKQYGEVVGNAHEEYLLAYEAFYGKIV